MSAYIVRRVFSAVGVLLMDIVLVFMLLQLTPGDPAVMIVGGEMIGSGDVESVRRSLGLDKPLHIQLFNYVSRAVRGDLGRSFFTKEPITDMIKQRLPVSFSLAVAATIVGLVIALPAGILAAVKRGSALDQSFMFVAIFGVSMPAFWLGIILMLILAVQFRIFPVVGYVGLFESARDWLRHLVLPTLAIGLSQSALIARMTRSSLLEILRQDYVALTAKAKGVAPWRVILMHALPNAAFPIMTVVGMSVAYLIGGVVVIETVFAMPGLGWLLIHSVMTRDYPVVQGVLLFIAAVNVVANLIVDLSYAFIDKRVRYE